MKSLLFLTDLDQPALARLLPGLAGVGGGPMPDAGSAAADWLGVPMPAAPAWLRREGEAEGEGEGDAAPPPTGWLACMDPVSMAADMRELHMQDAAPPLDEDEAAALTESLLPSLQERGFTLHVAAPTRWYVASGSEYEFTAAAPTVAATGRIRDELPAGPDAAVFRALGNEIQMLWHEHPVNRRRAGRGLPPVNSVWFWGSGRAPAAAVDGRRPPPLYAADPLLTGLWRRLRGEVDLTPATDRVAPALAAGCVMTLGGEALTRPGIRKALRRGRTDIFTRDGLRAVPPRRGLAALLSAWRRR